MSASHRITIDGKSFVAGRGELLLDAALRNGVDLPHDCRAGHCGTCCVRLVTGAMRGGEGADPGIVHACQCRIICDAVIESGQASGARTVEGVLTSLFYLSPEVMEVGIRTHDAMPYRAGQYARVRFNGFPNRSYSFISHALRSECRLGLVPCPTHEGGAYHRIARQTNSTGPSRNAGGSIWLGSLPAKSETAH